METHERGASIPKWKERLLKYIGDNISHLSSESIALRIIPEVRDILLEDLFRAGVFPYTENDELIIEAKYFQKLKDANLLPEKFEQNNLQGEIPLKIEKRLKEDLKNAKRILGVDILPPNISPETTLTAEYLERHYPERSRIMRRLLKETPSGSSESENTATWVSALNKLHEYVANRNRNTDSGKGREARQLDVFEDILTFFEQGGRTGYIKLPTGSGKTVIFAKLLEALGLRTLIVVPTKVLLSQTEKRLDEFIKHDGVGKIYTHAKQFKDSITLTTYLSFVKNLQKGLINPEQYELLILDEAHEALSGSRREAVKKFGNAVTLGFTATPEYHEEKAVIHLLEHEIHAMSIREAVEEGMMTPFRNIIVKTNADISNVRINKEGEYIESDLEEVINAGTRNEAALKIYKEFFKDETAIAFCNSIAHAESFKSLLEENGISAATISAYTPEHEREELLARFKRGEIKVLCNAKLLTIGFDEPRASVALNLRPTRSKVHAEQRSGRVLRINPDDPNKVAVVVDFLDSGASSPNKSPVFFFEVADAMSAGIKPGDIKTNEKLQKIEHLQNVEKEVPKPLPHIDGIEIVTEIEEMREIRRAAEASENFSPITDILDAFSKEFDMNILEVRRSLFYLKENSREIHPDWFVRKKNQETGRREEHWNEHAINHARESFLEIRNVLDALPDGWLSRRTLLERYVRSSVRRRTIILNHINEERDKFDNQHVRRVRVGDFFYETYCSPELVKKIETFMQMEGMPNDNEDTETLPVLSFFEELKRITGIQEKSEQEKSLLQLLPRINTSENLVVLFTYKNLFEEGSVSALVLEEHLSKLQKRMSLDELSRLKVRAPNDKIRQMLTREIHRKIRKT